MCHPQGVGADPHVALALPPESKGAKEKEETPSFQYLDEEMSIRIGRAGLLSGKPPFIYPQLQLSGFNVNNSKSCRELWPSQCPTLQLKHLQKKKNSINNNNNANILEADIQNKINIGLYNLTWSFSDGLLLQLIFSLFSIWVSSCC